MRARRLLGCFIRRFVSFLPYWKMKWWMLTEKQFDDLIEEKYRSVNLYPSSLRTQIDETNEWHYNLINNGVYKIGFATTQEAYDANIYPLFESLDRLEKHLMDPAHQPYLFGEHITEADIRLYTTMIRFDVAYVPIFQCNLRMIRHGYPRLWRS